jgi:hypothetical protein
MPGSDQGSRLRVQGALNSNGERRAHVPPRGVCTPSHCRTQDTNVGNSGPDPSDVQKAKELCVDLLDNVRAEYEKFKANPPPQQQYGGYGNGSYQSRDRPSYGGYGSYGGAQSPPMPGAAVSPTTPAAPPGTAGSPTDYAAQYAQYYAGGQDPYAAYGGYQGYVQYYQYYAQQQTTQQGQAPPPPPPGNDAPPPPPGGAPPSASSNPPPPPPPGAPGAGSYSAVGKPLMMRSH